MILGIERGLVYMSGCKKSSSQEVLSYYVIAVGR